MTQACIAALIISIATQIGGVPPYFVLAIALEEHGGHIRTEAVSPPNRNGTVDLGTMQLNSRYFGHIDWRCPEVNITAGVKHIKWLISQLNTFWLVSVAYNCGLNRLREGNPPRASLDYADRVMARWKELDPQGFMVTTGRR